MPLLHLFELRSSGLLANPVEAKKSWLKLAKAGQHFALAQELGLPSSEITYKGERDALQLWIATGRL
jgi:hypothetical protein